MNDWYNNLTDNQRNALGFSAPVILNLVVWANALVMVLL